MLPAGAQDGVAHQAAGRQASGAAVPRGPPHVCVRHCGHPGKAGPPYGTLLHTVLTYVLCIRCEFHQQYLQNTLQQHPAILRPYQGVYSSAHASSIRSVPTFLGQRF